MAGISRRSARKRGGRFTPAVIILSANLRSGIVPSTSPVQTVRLRFSLKNTASKQVPACSAATRNAGIETPVKPVFSSLAALEHSQRPFYEVSPYEVLRKLRWPLKTNLNLSLTESESQNPYHT